MINNKFNFEYAATLQKTGKVVGNKIPIKIIPNVPTADRVDDTIHLKAFDDPTCRKSFISEGVLDWDHQTVRGKTPLEKAKAVVGKPEKLYVDNERNLPVCEGYLFANNPYVKEAILPALETESGVLGASVGGKVLKSVAKSSSLGNKGGNDIYKIHLKHIAICLLQNAIHGGTSVELKKSIENNNENIFSFNSVHDLLKSFDNKDFLEKALTAGSTTDIANISGGQALQNQSLEGDKIVSAVLPFFLENVINGRIENNQKVYKSYLLNKGLSDKISSELIKLVAENSYKIAKKIL